MTLNVAMVQGNSVTLSFEIKDSNGSSINLTSLEVAEIMWVLKDTATSTVPLLTKLLTADEVFIRDPADGQVDVDILPQDTTNLTGNYVHELILYSANGDVITVTADTEAAYGEFVIRQAIAYT